MGDPGEHGGNVRGSFMFHRTDRFSIYALVFLHQGRVRGNREEGRPLGTFIDLRLIAGQSWTCWTERRERRARMLSSLIIRTSHVSLALPIQTLCFLLSGTSRASGTTRKTGKIVTYN